MDIKCTRRDEGKNNILILKKTRQRNVLAKIHFWKKYCVAYGCAVVQQDCANEAEQQNH